jgi:transcriptional regulator of acetoin/glycerol metabolism
MQNSGLVCPESVPSQSNELSPADEARWGIREGLNVLMISSPMVATNLLQRVRGDLRLPVRDCGCMYGLPQLDGVHTLVAHDVAELDPTQQNALLRWLDEYGAERQVISLTADPLFPLVQRGTFLDRLYYRLNVITVHCIEEGVQDSAHTDGE